MQTDHRQGWRDALGEDQQGADALWSLLNEVDQEDSAQLAIDVDSAWAAVKAKRATPRSARTARPRRRFAPYAIAASFAILALLAVNYFSGGSADTERYVNTSEVAETFALLDNSTVGLDPGASLLFTVDKEHRTASLLGSANFDVTSDADRPFRVEAQGFEVIVVGTNFRVEATSQAAMVRVNEGHVRVRGNREADWVDLFPGDVVTIREQLVSQVTGSEGSETTLKFSNSSLADVAARLQAAGGPTLVLPEHLNACAVTADFADATPEEIVQALAALFNADLITRRGIYTLQGGHCR